MITPCFAAFGVPGVAPKAQFPRQPAPGRLGPAALVLLACLGAAAWSDVPRRSRPAAAPIFATRVRPLLAARCTGGHGPSRASGGLRLDSARGILAGGAGGPVVVPGRPEQSRLIQAIEGRGARKMPPEGRLSAGEIGTLRQWISEGAPVPPDAAANAGPAAGKHWAFLPLRLPAVPGVAHAERVRTPVDAYVLARLRENRLAPAPDAAWSVLIRRASFDLHGLPPTPAEVDAFLADTRPDAYERLLDRLLASPQFGVRWGRHWLDSAGYTDTVSFDEDFGPPIGTVEGKWRYRDYVVNAFNSDKPYHEFVREQLACDEMTGWRRAATYSPEVIEKLVATGYLRTVEDISLEDPRPFVICSEVDRPSAALIQDLKQRGLLDETVVLWTGEFGRMPISQGGNGRDHNPHGFTVLLAGGGFKAGHVHGATDELGYAAVTDRVGVPDLMATILHQLGLDHNRVAYDHLGSPETMTDARVSQARVVTELLQHPTRTSRAAGPASPRPAAGAGSREVA